MLKKSACRKGAKRRHRSNRQTALHGNLRGGEPSLGTTAAVPWHCTTLVDFVYHWQTLLAGLIAMVAAIITVAVTLKVERRKVDRELDALHKSLAIELRQLIPRALAVNGKV